MVERIFSQSAFLSIFGVVFRLPAFIFRLSCFGLCNFCHDLEHNYYSEQIETGNRASSMIFE